MLLSAASAGSNFHEQSPRLVENTLGSHAHLSGIELVLCVKPSQPSGDSRGVALRRLLAARLDSPVPEASEVLREGPQGICRSDDTKDGSVLLQSVFARRVLTHFEKAVEVVRKGNSSGSRSAHLDCSALA